MFLELEQRNLYTLVWHLRLPSLTGPASREWSVLATEHDFSGTCISRPVGKGWMAGSRWRLLFPLREARWLASSLYGVIIILVYDQHRIVLAPRRTTLHESQLRSFQEGPGILRESGKSSLGRHFEMRSPGRLWHLGSAWVCSGRPNRYNRSGGWNTRGDSCCSFEGWKSRVRVWAGLVFLYFSWRLPFPCVFPWSYLGVSLCPNVLLFLFFFLI